MNLFAFTLYFSLFSPANGFITSVQAAGIVVDNGEPGTFAVKSWAVSRAPNPYGRDSLYSTLAGASYTYQVNVPASGAYRVYLWWTEYSNRSTNVPVDITHIGGTATVTLDQQRNGGKWNLAGTWSFGRRATITILSPGGGTTCADAVKLVRDPGTLPTLSIRDAAVVTEGDFKSVAASFIIRLSLPSPRAVTAAYATRAGTAAAGTDYVTRTGTLSLSAGQTTFRLLVPVVGDTLPEPTESFSVVLSDPTGALLGDARGVATIIDDDGPPAGESGLDVRPSNPGCVLLDRPGSGGEGEVAVREVFSNLAGVSKVAILQAPGDSSQWYLLDRAGLVRRFPNRDDAASAPICLDLRSQVEKVTEGGLTSMAFHPGFASNGHAYIFYTTVGSPWRIRVSRFTSTNGGATFDPGSERVIIAVDLPTEIHAGGQINFGPDGYLYIGLGDLGREANSQNTGTLGGSMLRVDVDGGNPYSIPATNPFATGSGGLREIYAWGFRNPWRWSFDRETGALWLADVGSSDWEEVDLVERGRNYGWPGREGSHCYRAAQCNNASFTGPLAEYSHQDGDAVIGGYVYRGTAIPSLVGHYLYGDYGSGNLWALPADGQAPAVPRLVFRDGEQMLSFAEDSDGEIYLVGTQRHIFQLVPAGVQAPDNFPQRLSDVPCVDPLNPSRPGLSLIPYDVNVPFWSDGAVKERWLALPDGAEIHIQDDGDWEFPIGTVLMKHFRLAGRLIETRLFVRHGDGGWGGYSYEWNDAQTDATLLAESKTKLVDDATWTFPSRAQCLACHTEAAGRVLGLETAQMNRSITYPATGRTANQLATFDHIGLFDEPLTVPPEALPALPLSADQSESVELRARAYLHANCSHCHRPEGPGGGTMDLRYSISFAAMNICNAVPARGDLGVPGARILRPGDPAHSVISLRMHAIDSTRMPPIARIVVDSAGATLMDDWIRSVSSCP